MILHRCVSFDVPFRLPGHFSTLRRYRRRTSLEMLWVFGSLERQTLSDLFVLCCDVVYLAVVCGGQRVASLSSSPTRLLIVLPHRDVEVLLCWLMWHSVIWYQFLRCGYMIFTCSRHIPIVDCRYVPTFSSASINTHVFTPHLYSSAKPLRSVPSSSQTATVDRYTHQIIARCPTKNQSPTTLRRRKRKIMKKRLMVRCTKVLLSLCIARMH